MLLLDLETRPWPRLKSLDISRNILSVLDDETLQYLHAIQSLNLSYNTFTQIPLSLRHLHALDSLSLRHNQLTDLSQLRLSLGNVTRLDLSCNQITSTRGLERLWALRNLDISDNRLTDDVELIHLCRQLPELVQIAISGNPLSKAVMISMI